MSNIYTPKVGEKFKLKPSGSEYRADYIGKTFVFGTSEEGEEGCFNLKYCEKVDPARDAKVDDLTEILVNSCFTWGNIGQDKAENIANLVIDHGYAYHDTVPIRDVENVVVTRMSNCRSDDIVSAIDEICELFKGVIEDE